MFRVLFAPILMSTTAAYNHRCVYGFGMLVHWSRYWLGYPHTFSTANFRQSAIDHAKILVYGEDGRNRFLRNDRPTHQTTRRHTSKFPQMVTLRIREVRGANLGLDTDFPD
jgi:hypothetical protein